MQEINVSGPKSDCSNMITMFSRTLWKFYINWRSSSGMKFKLPSFQYCCLQRTCVLGMECYKYISMCLHPAWFCCLKVRTHCLLGSLLKVNTIPGPLPFTTRDDLFTYFASNQQETATTDFHLTTQATLSIQTCSCVALLLMSSSSCWQVLNCPQMNNFNTFSSS